MELLGIVGSIASILGLAVALLQRSRARTKGQTIVIMGEEPDREMLRRRSRKLCLNLGFLKYESIEEASDTKVRPQLNFVSGRGEGLDGFDVKPRLSTQSTTNFEGRGESL